MVNKCVDGNEGKKLQLNAEEETKKISIPRLESVPTIVFNNVCVHDTDSFFIFVTPKNCFFFFCQTKNAILFVPLLFVLF